MIMTFSHKLILYKHITYLPNLLDLLCYAEFSSPCAVIGHEDAQIETLLLQLLYESTETSPPTSPRPMPYFDAPSNINLTTQLGAAVVFHCRVNGLVDEALVGKHLTIVEISL